MYTIASWVAFLACAFCKLVGSKVDGVMRYLGYLLPVKTEVGAGAGQEFQMGRSDGRLLTEKEQRAQARAAAYNRARGYEPPPGNRFKGHSPLIRELYWVDPRRLWVIPFSHAFSLGVFKDFLAKLFAKESRKPREVRLKTHLT